MLIASSELVGDTDATSIVIRSFSKLTTSDEVIDTPASPAEARHKARKSNVIRPGATGGTGGGHNYSTRPEPTMRHMQHVGGKGIRHTIALKGAASPTRKDIGFYPAEITIHEAANRQLDKADAGKQTRCERDMDETDEQV